MTFHQNPVTVPPLRDESGGDESGRDASSRDTSGRQRANGEDPAAPEFDAAQDDLIDDILELAAQRKRPMRPVIVLIDGPSGAGKTWFAARLAERTNWQPVHLDEFYPGWHGLARGSEMVSEQVLREMNPGYWRWDWEANAPGEWVSLDARDDLIVEGVGAITPESRDAAEERGAVITVFITGPRDERRARAIARDPGYEEWFETWEAQEAEHFKAQGLPDNPVTELDLIWDWTEPGDE